MFDSRAKAVCLFLSFFVRFSGSRNIVLRIVLVSFFLFLNLSGNLVFDASTKCRVRNYFGFDLHSST